MISWNPSVRQLVRMALTEDLGTWDLTSAILPPGERGTGKLIAKQAGVLAGTELIELVFAEMGVDRQVAISLQAEDGARVAPGDALATLEGETRALLVAERTFLNLLQRLSGIATATRSLVDLVAGTRARVVDTRKTLPGWRALEKYAVTVGGGSNHRHGLSGGVLIKDNHIDALGGIARAVAEAKRTAPTTVKIEVEVRDERELREAIDAGADIVMLDNMSLDEMNHAVRAAKGQVALEASGNITIDTIRAVAETGVDYISVGAITHSVSALDISFNLQSPKSEGS